MVTPMKMSMFLICIALPCFMGTQVGASVIYKNCSWNLRGRVFSLWPLADINHNPRFQIDNGINNYAYNPCLPFTRGKCKDVAVCRWDAYMKHFTVLGLNALGQIQLYQNHPQIVYRVSETSNTRTFVRLKCNPNLDSLNDGVMKLITENQTQLVIEIEHACCCPDKCKDGLPTPNPKPCPISKNGPFIATVAVLAVVVVVFILVGCGCYCRKMANERVRNDDNPPLLAGQPARHPVEADARV